MEPKKALTTTDKPHAVGYVRVSTEAQAKDKNDEKEEKESLPGQRKAIKAHAALKGWDLLNIYEDKGITGKKDDRPGLQALLGAAKLREFDIVIVRDLSRFGRSARDLLNNAKSLMDHGVVFVSLNESMELDSGNPYSQFLFQVLSAVAELEHSMIRERLSSSRMSKWRDHKIFNGTLPLGYAWNEQSRAIEAVPEEAAIYQRVVTEYLDLGKSALDIALGLTRDAVPTRLGRRAWSVAAICQFLRNPAYKGIITSNTKKLDEKGRVLGDKPAMEHIIFEAPPLISKSRWDELQERLESARQRSGRPIIGARQFLLHGMLRCGECGGKVVPRLGKRRVDGSAPRSYVCHYSICGKSSLKLAGREKCTLPPIPAQVLEGHLFWGHLMIRLGLNKEKYYLPAIDLGKWDKKIQAAQRKLEQLQDVLKKKGFALRNVDSLLERQDFDPNEFKGKRNVILSEIHALNQQMEEAVSGIESLHKLREQEDLLAKFADDKKGALKEVHKKIVTLPDEGKQRLLRGMLAGPVVVKRPDPRAKIGDGPLDDWLDFSFRFNPAILREALEDGVSGKNSKSGFSLIAGSDA